MQLTKFSKLKIIHTPGKNLSVADMLSRSFTKAELQLNKLKHKQLPPQIDFALLQDNTLKPVHYLIKHEEILPHQKHDSDPILADYGTDQFSIRINDKGNDIVVKPLQSFSFESITPFQTKFKTPKKKNNKTLHQQSLLLNDTDITSDDDDHIYTKIPKSDCSFLHDTPKDWAFQVHMYAYAHNSQPLSELSISPHEIVFHTRPRIPLTFDLNLNRDTSKTCISRYCSQLPEHSHYDKSDFNPCFYRTLSKPIPHWFLAVETAMLQIYSTVYENTTKNQFTRIHYKNVPRR